MEDSMTARYFARSANDKTDDWPFWFVADSQRGGLNVTAELIRALANSDHKGATLAPRFIAELIAEAANKARTEARA
jgi:hypothetical protein